MSLWVSISGITACLSVVVLDAVRVVNIYPGLAIVLSLIWFLLACRRRYYQPNLFLYDHSLLVIYSKVLALIMPEIIIFVKVAFLPCGLTLIFRILRTMHALRNRFS